MTPEENSACATARESQFPGRVEHRGDMAGNFHFPPYLPYLSFVIDKECGAVHSHIAPPIHAFFHPHAIGVRGFEFGIGSERDLQFVFLAKFLVRFDAVFRNADYRDAERRETFLFIRKSNRLLRAAGGIVPGIKIHDKRLSLEFCRRNFAAIVGWKPKGRCPVAR